MVMTKKLLFEKLNDVYGMVNTAQHTDTERLQDAILALTDIIKDLVNEIERE